MFYCGLLVSPKIIIPFCAVRRAIFFPREFRFIDYRTDNVIASNMHHAAYNKSIARLE